MRVPSPGSPGHLYLVHLREFIRTREPVFKVGRTDNLHRRMQQYPKGSRLVAACHVADAVQAETALLRVLRGAPAAAATAAATAAPPRRRSRAATAAAWTMRKDLGKEYVQGDPRTLTRALLRTGLAAEHCYGELLEREREPEPQPLPQPQPHADDGHHDAAVVAFVRAKAQDLSRATVPSLDLHAAYRRQASRGRRAPLPLAAFLDILRRHFAVAVKVMRLPEPHGLCQAVVFGKLGPLSARPHGRP